MMEPDLRAMLQGLLAVDLLHRPPLDGPLVLGPRQQPLQPGRRLTSGHDGCSMDGIQMSRVGPILRDILDVAGDLQTRTLIIILSRNGPVIVAQGHT